MADFDREDLAYTSQAGLYEDDTAPVNDEQDISALREIKKMADDLREEANSNGSLVLGDPELPVETQLFGYQFALSKLEPLLATIDNAIEKVRKQGRG